MEEQYLRNIFMIGENSQKKLAESTVIVIGVGGVGSHSVESLARAGVGNLILIDSDNFDITNLNRQLGALHKTINKKKVDVMKSRILEINPKCNVQAVSDFIDASNVEKLLEFNADFLIDAIDTFDSKYELIKFCLKQEVKFISCMGTGNKLDPLKYKIAEITKTSYDPLAKKLRIKLRKERIKGKVMTVFSDEEPIKTNYAYENYGKHLMGSISYMPAIAGYIASSYVIRQIIK